MSNMQINITKTVSKKVLTLGSVQPLTSDPNFYLKMCNYLQMNMVGKRYITVQMQNLTTNVITTSKIEYDIRPIGFYITSYTLMTGDLQIQLLINFETSIEDDSKAQLCLMETDNTILSTNYVAGATGKNLHKFQYASQKKAAITFTNLSTY